MRYDATNQPRALEQFAGCRESRSGWGRCEVHCADDCRKAKFISDTRVMMIDIYGCCPINALLPSRRCYFGFSPLSLFTL